MSLPPEPKKLTFPDLGGLDYFKFEYQRIYERFLKESLKDLEEKMKEVGEPKIIVPPQETEELKTEIVGEWLVEDFEKENIDSIGKIADLAVKKSVRHAETRFEAFRKEAEEKLDALFNKRPVLHIQINDGQTTELSSRPSPHLPRLVTNAKLGLHTMLVGPAGCGKTTVAHQLAESLGLQFGSVCLTAGASETWLFGRQTPSGFVEGAFSKIYREGGVFLADEMDAADANLLLSINTALSHKMMLNPMSGEMIKRSDKFVFIGAANTNGKGATHLYTGRSRLDAATLDRMVIINVDYDKDLEWSLCPDRKIFDWLQDTRAKLREAGFDEFVSTRAFISTFKQIEAGVEPSHIRDSLSANWGDGAKKIIKNCFDQKQLPMSKKQSSGKLKFTGDRFGAMGEPTEIPF